MVARVVLVVGLCVVGVYSTNGILGTGYRYPVVFGWGGKVTGLYVVLLVVGLRVVVVVVISGLYGVVLLVVVVVLCVVVRYSVKGIFGTG